MRPDGLHSLSSILVLPCAMADFDTTYCFAQGNTQHCVYLNKACMLCPFVNVILCRFLNESIIVDAVQLLLKIWQIEQHHEERSTYRYMELPREGRGPNSAYTGATHSSLLHNKKGSPQIRPLVIASTIFCFTATLALQVEFAEFAPELQYCFRGICLLQYKCLETCSACHEWCVELLTRFSKSYPIICTQRLLP